MTIFDWLQFSLGGELRYERYAYSSQITMDDRWIKIVHIFQSSGNVQYLVKVSGEHAIRYPGTYKRMSICVWGFL